MLLPRLACVSLLLFGVPTLAGLSSAAIAQDESVRPGIDDRVQDAIREKAKVLLERVLKNQRITDQIDAEGTVRIAATGHAGTRYNFHFVRDGKLVRVFHQSTYRPAEGKEVKRDHEAVFGPEILIAYQFDPARAHLQRKGFVIKQDKEKELQRFFGCQTHVGQPLDGYLLADERRLVEHLIESPDLTVEASEQGEIVTVSGTTPFGVASISIDPSRGHVLTRAELAKGPEHLACSNLTMKDAPFPPNTPRDALKNSEAHALVHPTGMNITLDNIESQFIDEVWVPVAGTLKHEQVFSDGGTRVTTTTYKRRINSVGKPIEADLLKSTLPPETIVTFADHLKSGVIYKWDGEEVVVTRGGAIPEDSTDR